VFRFVPCAFRHTHKKMPLPTRSSKGLFRLVGLFRHFAPTRIFYPFALSLTPFTR
jgi:hypothetical protein